MKSVGGKIYINDDEFDRLKKEGLNQKQIAKILNLSESKISNYVKGRFKNEQSSINRQTNKRSGS
ncbi:hypothetical protein SAMN05428976_11329 [Clostridium sp. USBA 49]|uniref:hypothetical protein n=1 Tax=Clostridium sp. USBA 49 TaxID=1881060 RepID=UPI000999B9E6|nr:hypothetical protein [Clostridium sp. USBA 49]SKA89555.1 hypothetical protein SAMN05428976_11329 [Clostridium sp. USBA 49]